MTKTNMTKNLSYGVTAFCLIFSYTLCFSAVLNLNIWYALITAVTSAILSVSLKNKVLAPHPFFIVPLLLAFSNGTNSFLPFSVIFGTIIYVIFNKKCVNLRLPSSVLSGFTLGLAFSVTALLTTHYFGIGADGVTVLEILKDYRSLGFHPNFRGVFFGTVTLFAMITYPFKFKKLNTFFPAEMFSILLPLLLNLVINPNPENTPINELSALTDFSSKTEISFFLPSLTLNTDVIVKDYIYALFSAISIGILLLFYKNANTRSDTKSTSSFLNGILGGFPTTVYKIRGYSIPSAIVVLVLCIYFSFLFPELLGRIPLHSLSVVLIVSAWKSVCFKEIAKTFKSGIFSIISMIVIFLCFIFLNIFWAIVACSIVTAITYSAERRAENG